MMEIKPNRLICGGKFVFSHNTICLLVSFNQIPDQIIFNEKTFVINTFLHVSLVCVSKIIEKYNVLIPNFENKIINDFCEFSRDNKVKKVEHTDDFKFVSKEDKETIIVMCKIPNLDKFFELINKKYELNIKYPPTHVTIYTLPGKLGIFLTDENDIKKLTKPIPNPIGHSL